MRGKPAMILLVAWLGWVFDIMDTALFNFAKGPMLISMLGSEEAYKLQGPALEGRIQMAFLVGWAIGGLVFGILADRWGRTRVMMLTILLYCLFTGLTAFCQTPDQVAWIRFLTALGIGGEWAAGAALIAESFSDQQRPWAAAILQTAAAFGPWFAALLNFALVKPGATYFGFAPWQALFLVGVLPAAVVVLIRWLVPEPERRQTAGPPLDGLRELFAEKQWARRAWLILVIGTVGIAGAGNAAFWLPNLVRAAVPDPAAVAPMLTQATLVQHLGTLAGVFFFPWLAKRFGRRIALGLGFGLALVFTGLLVVGPRTFDFLLLMAPVIAFAAIGVSAVFGLYFPELFPSRIRATGAGFGYNTARLLQSPLPWITGLMIAWQPNNPAIGVALAASIYVIGLIALAFAPETKDQPLPA